MFIAKVLLSNGALLELDNEQSKQKLSVLSTTSP